MYLFFFFIIPYAFFNIVEVVNPNDKEGKAVDSDYQDVDNKEENNAICVYSYRTVIKSTYF